MPDIAPPTALRFDHHPAPVLGLGNPTPRLSWQVPSAPADYTQTRYEIEVNRTPGRAEGASVGGTEVFQVASGEQVLVPWPGAALGAREVATVRVRVGDAESWSSWSEEATVEAGLLDAGDWTARFVSAREIGGWGSPSPILSGTVELPAGVVKGRLYASAHGLYEARLNGVRVGDEHLAPGWTAYQHRLRYQAHDVTGLLVEGVNRLEVQLGNGWFRGYLGFRNQHSLYGDRLALLAQLEVETADGRVLTLATDGSWTAREGTVVEDDIYNGQRTDLRRELSPESPVDVLDADLGLLVAPDGPPVRVTEVLPAVAVTTSPSGKTLVDFGQNLVGWVRLTVRGAQRDQRVVVRHAEVLEDGELGVRPLREARATDEWILAGPAAGGSTQASAAEAGAPGSGEPRSGEPGSGEPGSGEPGSGVPGSGPGSGEPRTGESGSGPSGNRSVGDGPDDVVLEPSLTFHGFRYAEVSGIDDLRAEDIQAVVVGSDLRRTGWFESSHELLNRFHENVIWGMRGNFVDVPTDCPQRDERLGWTGDIQVFSPTASFLFDSAGFLTNWLADLAAEQQKDGSVPHVVPDVIRQTGPAAAAWGDAAAIVPWVVYQRTGDVGLLARQLPSMRAWVDRISGLAGDGLLWAGGFQFGDWLDPAAPPEDPFRAKADPDVVATAHLARSAEIVAQAALAIGDGEVAREYGELAERVRAAFAREYVTDGGRVLSDAATTYALALQWALLPTAEQRREAGQRLADLVRAAGFRISTGFVGTPLMTDALTDSGHPDLAYRLLLQTGVPSWLYPVTMGATTVWERWDSMLPDGSINPGQMTSFNHYALGAVADWLHRRVAGLAPGEPGYRRLDVRPLPDRRLTRASATHLTPYGKASVAWQRENGELRLEVVVPVGATATVQLPDGDKPIDVRHGTHEWVVGDPYAQEAALPAEPTIRQVMDHAPTWDKLVATAREAGVAPSEATLAESLQRYLDAPATEFAAAATAHGFVPGGDQLAARLTALLSPSSDK